MFFFHYRGQRWSLLLQPPGLLPETPRPPVRLIAIRSLADSPAGQQASPLRCREGSHQDRRRV
jgi:hypothetical protein